MYLVDSHASAGMLQPRLRDIHPPCVPPFSTPVRAGHGTARHRAANRAADRARRGRVVVDLFGTCRPAWSTAAPRRHRDQSRDWPGRDRHRRGRVERHSRTSAGGRPGCSAATTRGTLITRLFQREGRPAAACCRSGAERVVCGRVECLRRQADGASRLRRRRRTRRRGCRPSSRSIR